MERKNHRIMGYYTYFQIKTLTGTKEDFEAICNELSKKTGVYVDEAGCVNESIKWYDWRKDLSEISERHPDVIIEVDGDGEVCDDLWRARFRNGHIEVHSLVDENVIFTSIIPDAKATLTAIDKKAREAMSSIISGIVQSEFLSAEERNRIDSLLDGLLSDEQTLTDWLSELNDWGYADLRKVAILLSDALDNKTEN